MSAPVYLDHNATTPLDHRVLDAMMPYLTGEFGNPSSTTHEWGHRARHAVEEARAEVAALLKSSPHEIVFTAGATESNNIALKGRVRFRERGGRRGHLVTSAIEHPSVLEAVRALEAEGFVVTVVPPDDRGVVSETALTRVVREDTELVSVMAANGETGTVQPLETLARACRDRGVIFHTDAAQAVGKIPVDVGSLGCDLLSLSAHKFYGPKGVGALYVREGTGLAPLVSGGGQERGLRPGTLNVPGIVGLGVAARLCRQEQDEEGRNLTRLRNLLWEGIRRAAPDARQNGDPERRLPGCLNVAIPRVPASRLLAELTEFAFSAGSACHSDNPEPSPVLTAMGLERDLALCSVRFCLGRLTTEEQVRSLVTAIKAAMPRIRGL